MPHRTSENARHRIHEAKGVDGEAADRHYRHAEVVRSHGKTLDRRDQAQTAWAVLPATEATRGTPMRLAPADDLRSQGLGYDRAPRRESTPPPPFTEEEAYRIRLELRRARLDPGRVPCFEHAVAVGTPCYRLGDVGKGWCGPRVRAARAAAGRAAAASARTGRR